MKKTFTSIFLFFFFFIATTKAQNFQAFYVAGDFGLTPGIAANANQIVMQSGINANSHDVLLTSTDMHGSVLWSHSYGDISVDEARSLLATSDHCFLVCGISVATGATDQTGMIFKIDSSGTVQWRLKIGDGIRLEAIGAIEISDRGYIVLAREGQNAFYLLRLDEAGNEIWMNKYFQSDLMNAESIIGFKGSDNFFLTGERWNSGIASPFACRMDESGAVVWSTSLSWPRSVVVTASNADAENHLYLAFEDRFFYLVTLDENGLMLHSTLNGFADSPCHMHNNVHSILPLPNGLVLLRADFNCSLNQNGYIAYMDTKGNEVWGVSDPFFNGSFSIPPNTVATLLTSGNDFLFFENSMQTGQPMTLVKSNLTLTSACSKPFDSPFIHDTVSIATGNFAISAASFSGIYRRNLDRDNYQVATNIGCINNCRAASLFRRPKIAEGYICKSSTINFKNYSFNATSYRWYADFVQVSSATDLNYTFSSIGRHTISLVALDGSCSDSTSQVFQVEDASTLAAITANGATTLCSGGSVTLQANYENIFFQWKRNGVLIPGATNSFFLASTAGNYTCDVINDCGNATSNTLTVTINSGSLPLASIAANGPISFCTGGSVSLSANTGSGLSWQWRKNIVNIPGASGSVYSATSTGNYSCVVSNSCGSSTSNTISVSVNSLPAQPGIISGPASVCKRQNNVVYTIAAVTGATSYTWTVPSGTKINSGQGTTAINVKFGNAAGNITVKANNSCGSGALQSLSISMPCREAFSPNTSYTQIKIYPNPSSGLFTIVISQESGTAKIRIHDVTGRLVEKHDEIPVNAEFSFGESLSNGVYFAEIIVGDSHRVIKLIKENN